MSIVVDIDGQIVAINATFIDELDQVTAAPKDAVYTWSVLTGDENISVIGTGERNEIGLVKPLKIGNGVVQLEITSSKMPSSLFNTLAIDVKGINIQPDNIVSWLNLSESTTNNIIDVNTNNSWSNVVGSVVVNDGALIFDGVSHLESPDTGDWNFGNGDFTIELEVFIDSSYDQSWYGLLNKRGGDGWNCCFSFYYHDVYGDSTDSEMYFGMSATGEASGDFISFYVTPTIDRWSKISITRRGLKAYLHIDGVLTYDKNISDQTMFWTEDETILLGVLNSSYKTNRYFKGMIRHLRVLKDVALYDSRSYVEFKNLT